MSINFDDLSDQIKNSKIARKIQVELLVLAKRGNQATRKAVQSFLNYLDQNPHIKEWLKSSAIVGVALEIMPFSRLGLLAFPGFVPGALAGFLKGRKTDSVIQSAVIGGAASWPIKPILLLSPIAGMLLVAFAAGILEKVLSQATDQAGVNESFNAA